MNQGRRSRPARPPAPARLTATWTSTGRAGRRRTDVRSAGRIRSEVLRIDARADP